MAKSDHTEAVRGVLTGQGLNIGDSNIYDGPFHENAPENAIAITESGGVRPANEFGSTTAIQRPQVQVTIRHDDKTKAKSDADDVWRLLQDNTPSGGYSRSDMLQSSPLGPIIDDDGRYKYTVNVELFIYE